MMLSTRLVLGGRRALRLRPSSSITSSCDYSSALVDVRREGGGRLMTRLQSTTILGGGGNKRQSLKHKIRTTTTRTNTSTTTTTTTATKNTAYNTPIHNKTQTPNHDKNNRDILIAASGLVFCFALTKGYLYLKEKRDHEDSARLSKYLRREMEQRRPDWKEACDKIGFPFCNYPGVKSRIWYGETDPYWNESASYRVHPNGRWMLERAAFEIHSMCLEAADDVIASDKLLEKFEIPRELWEAVRYSWQMRQPDIAGRFDLLWDGTTEPKLAEYNADTPTVLIESAIAQEDWFKAVYGEKGGGKKNNDGDFSQFNNITSAMEEAFRRIKRQNPDAQVIFTTNRPSAESSFLEERSTAKFMQERAIQAGLQSQYVDIEDFDDPVLFETILKAASSEGNRSLLVWKLYPYEWLVQEKLGSLLTSIDFLGGNLRWLEPPWKLVLSSKAMLAYLWEKHRGHPNLLPTFWDSEVIKAIKNRDSNDETQWVAKPRFGREGVGIMYSDEYSSWDEFARAVQNASSTQSIYTTDTRFYGYKNNSAGASASISGSNNLSGDTSGQDTAIKAAKELESYIGSFDEGAVSTALKERQWGTEHSQEESPLSGFFVGKPIFQQYFRPVQLQGFTIVTSAWVVNGVPAGICFREDLAKTTNDDSCFVPHVVTKEGSTEPESKVDFKYPLTARARRLREELYGKTPVGMGNHSSGGTLNGPMGYSGTGGGGHASGPFVRSYRGGRSSWSSWNPFGGARGETGKENNKASGSGGQKASNWAKQQRPMGGRTKASSGGRVRTGATARGASRGGWSARS